MSFFVFILDAIFFGTSFYFFRTVCGLYSHLDMFIAVPLTNYTRLAINAKPILRCGEFLSEKNCRHRADSLSFFLVLTTRHSLNFHKFEKSSCLFGLVMPCVFVDGTCECLIFDFSFFFCGIMAFFVSISDAVFLVTSFFPF